MDYDKSTKRLYYISNFFSRTRSFLLITARSAGTSTLYFIPKIQYTVPEKGKIRGLA